MVGGGGGNIEARVKFCMIGQTPRRSFAMQMCLLHVITATATPYQEAFVDADLFPPLAYRTITGARALFPARHEFIPRMQQRQQIPGGAGASIGLNKLL